MRIADAAYAAEDAIESHIVHKAQLSRSKETKDAMESHIVEKVQLSRSKEAKISCFFNCFRDPKNESSDHDDELINLYQDVQKVIEEMDQIKKEATESAAEAQLQRNVSSTRAGSLTFSSTVKESIMVGFDDVSLELLDRLTGGHRNRQIIPITGMGGIGKTTLALHIFEHALVKHHFDICGWATISQTYNVRETLREVLRQVSGNSGGDLSEEDLGDKLHKYLLCRRYLIILDDMWSVEVWDKMRFFFPDNNDGSRIIATTRLSNLAAVLTDSNSIGMRLLDDVSSWNLFSKTVFGDEGFPPQLEEIGKKIVEKCYGLPLSIVVIGGLLAKSELTLEYWEHIEKNLSSIVNSENDEYWLRVLKLSYDHLPAYLKPCFLYMGVFGEDEKIRVSDIIKRWVYEGFLKPITNKSMETVAKEYLKELVDRNLVLVNELGKLGNIKYCKMHDLLRDLSLKEAEKQRFYYVLGQHCPRGISSQRRIVIPRVTNSQRHILPKMILDENVCDALESMPLARSYLSLLLGRHHERPYDIVRQLLNCRLLRILTIHAYIHESYLKNVFQLMNLRYLSIGVSRRCLEESPQVPSSINFLWNLHTLIIIYDEELTAPAEIWKMHQLKHVECIFGGMYLPDPPSDDNVIMENLETLKGVFDLNLNEALVKRIPNIKKLYISYWDKLMDRGKCLRYVRFLSKLESFKCYIKYGIDEHLQSIIFPNSLKKLFLSCDIHIEEILEHLGWLPLLEKLQLEHGRFATRCWKIVEGRFPCLKYLSLDECANMECWTLEGSCLPRLEQLRLKSMRLLKAFPSEIGEIATLRSIELAECSESMAMSLKRIVDEQEELQGEPSFHVRVKSYNVSQELRSLATPNFCVGHA
ncbi:putative late blight resistance protein homolog R1C-3 [Salvia miltiorrhiza]|uniref:putative late blight resistance protein homolog R1C-3 n=1 Tax=Salvia miltiorrhiza TaxID=226208 RepID=UPI0025ABE063|nr:putative late blight resistance protein homolog R1C-3 [Salvia miltiorrhiza]